MTNSEFREHRKALKLTQQGLAEMIGYNRATVAGWEGRDPVPVVVARLLRLMVERSVPAEDLPPYASKPRAA